MLVDRRLLRRAIQPGRVPALDAIRRGKAAGLDVFSAQSEEGRGCVSVSRNSRLGPPEMPFTISFLGVWVPLPK